MTAPTEYFQPYAQYYENSKGLTDLNDARPTAAKIIEDEGLINKWSDKVVLITGTNIGIGAETAKVLHSTGAKVFMTVRNKAKAEPIIENIMKTSPSKVAIEVLEMELSNLNSVRKAAADFLARSDKLNVMINNAAIMATPFSKTDDGFESQIGINHISHFLFFSLLKDTLLKSSTPEFQSRVVNVSSSGHNLAPVDLDNINFEKEGSYEPFVSYGASKTANIWMANQIERLYGSQGLHGLSLHPGVIFETGLTGKTDPSALEGLASHDFGREKKNVQQGAATHVWAATAKGLEGKGGLYLSDCGVAKPRDENTETGGPEFTPWAYDEEKEKALWEYSVKATGVAGQ